MSETPRVFLLSPAFCGGRRATMLRRPQSPFPLALSLRQGSLTLGEAFVFLSGLYFRGKLAYAQAFGRAPGTSCGGLVITPSRGLQPPEMPMTLDLLDEFAAQDISLDDPGYRSPLERDVDALAGRVESHVRFVLLGSVATGKYSEVLTRSLGDRLEYPPAFVGRGDMSRGGLMLRCVDARTELPYAVLDAGARRHGPRPPRLDPLRRPLTPA